MGIGAIGKLTVMFGANMKGFDRAMKKAQRSIKKFGSGMKKMGRTLTMGLTTPLLAFAAASVKAFDTQIKAETKLLTALKGRGDIQKRLIAQAQELQQKTLFGDEETIAAQAMLATMGLEENAIKRLIPLVQDMAVAKGMDLVQAADLVAKSVGSSTNALSRYGIEITGAVGSTERLDSATGALTKMFLGQAEAIATKGLGAWTQLQMTLGDVSEEFGKIILDNINPLNDKLKTMTLQLKGLTTEQKESAVQWGALAAILGPLLIILGSLITAFSRILPFLVKIGTVIKANPFTILITALSGLYIKLDKGKPIADRLSDGFERLKLTVNGTRKEIKKFQEEGALDHTVQLNNEKVDPNSILGRMMGGGMTGGPGFRTPTINVPTPEPTEPSGGSSSTVNDLNKATEATKQYSDAVDTLIETNYTWGMSPVEDQFKGIVVWTQKATKAQQEYNEMVDTFKQSFTRSLESAFLSQGRFFESFIANMKRAIQQQLAMIAAQKITAALFAAGTGTGGIGIIGGLLKGLGLASGGLVTGPTMALVGEGSGTSISNPEVVAPLDKLRGMMGGGTQNVVVEGVIRGNDIFLSNSRAGRQRQRFV